MIIDWRVGGYINAETERTGTKCVSHAAVIRFYKAQLLLPLKASKFAFAAVGSFSLFLQFFFFVPSPLIIDLTPLFQTTH